MDYDDNDFQGQNLHLAGEGSSKVSPVLRPYALPKFDFDDGLHGHLRFDNLVENEVFLGIPSQEDNQWIEDFSRGSSGIEFSSSAAESCSISRCNNVWSEATSSESVAMLLKSVGQEEIAPGETIVEESDAGHELGSLTKQMEPHMKQDDKVMDVMDSGPALPSEELLEHFSRLDDVEAASQTQDAEISTRGSSGGLDPNSSSETCGLFVTQKNPEVDRKCDNENQVEADTSLNESLKYKMEKDSFGSGMKIDDIDSSSQDVPTSVDVLNNQESVNQESDVSFENANIVLTHTSETVGEHHILSKLVDTNDQILKGNTFETDTNNLLLPCSSKMEPIKQHTVETGISNFEEPSSLPLKGDGDLQTEPIEQHTVETGISNFEEPSSLPLKGDGDLQMEPIEQHTVETGISNFEGPSSLPLKGDGDLQIAEGCVEDIRSTEPDKGSKCEPLYLSNSTGIHQQFKENMLEDLPVIYQGDSNLEGRTIEVNNMKAGISASSELKMYPTQSTQGENSSAEGKNHLLGSQHQLDSEVSVSNSEASLLSGIDNKAFDGNGDGSSSNYVGVHSSLTVSHSTKFQGEKHTSENLKHGGDVCGVHKEDLNAEDHVPFPVVAGSMQTHKENLVSNPNDMRYDQDVPFNEKEKSKLPNDSISMECDIVKSPSSDKRVGPSSQVEGMQVNNVVIHSSKCDTSASNAPALDVALENANLVSHSTMDGVPSLSGIGAAEDQVTDQLEKNKKTEDEVSTESNLSSPKKSLERASKPGPVLELEKGASHNSAHEHETVDHSLSVVETCNLASESEGAGKLLHKTDGQALPTADTSSITSQSQHAVKANEISEISSNKLEVCPTVCDSTVKQDDGAEGLVVLGNHEEIGKNNEVASSQVADVVLATNKCEVFTEPLSITLSELRCNRDQNDHEGGDASAVSDKPNSGTPTVISSTVLSQSKKGKKEAVKESGGKSVPLSEVTVKSTSTRQNAIANDAATDERSFTFEVHPSASLSERKTSKDGQSFPISEACKISTIVEGSPSTPGVSQIDSKMVQALSHGISQAPVGEIVHGGSKDTADRKRRRVSGKATGKVNPKRVNRVIETTPSKHTEQGDKSCSMSMNLAGTSQLVQFDGSRPYGNVERSGTIPFGAVSIPTSTLPDLNNSALPSASFQQPFTDLQQVQLRAQIFVYGYLIQGAAPDEACMLSAFGASDGGRSVWEPVWRAFVEKLQGQKSYPNKSENSLQLSSGARPPDQSIKQGALQSKVLSSPVGRASSKGTPSPVVNSIIPLSSPLWNVATPSCDGLQSSGMPRSGLLDYHHTMSPLHSFQTPPSRSFVGHNTSWLSQAPFPGPWIASSQTSTFDASARFSLPMTEAVKLTPVKESFAPFPSGTKHVSPSTVVHSTVPNVSAGTPFLPDMKKVTVSSGQNSTNLKSRKRKKVTVSENPAQISLLTQTQTEPVSAPVITSHLSTSVVVSTPDCFASKGNASKIVTAVSPMSLTDHPKSGEQNADQNATLSEDSFSKVEEAKRQAEDAGALAAAAVSESQAVWGRLNKQKSSGLNPDVEAKLASAAAAVAAAASVAKAAAAAARIASNAAIQAKLMADEALISSGTSNSAQSNAASLSNVVNNLVKATPASILKGGDGSYSSSSIIVAAREAARRRVEAASAASKHAENLDAIVKAAELAAEAVSQAGIIVAMGNPLPFNELVEAGPQGYWKVPQVPREQVVISNDCIREQSKADSIEGLNVSGRHAKGGLSKKDVKTANFDLPPVSREASRESLEDHTRVADVISSSFTSSEKDSRGQRSHRVSDLAKNIAVIPESEIGSRSASVIAQDENEMGVGTLKENSIKEGCLVEVYKDGDDDLKAAWYSAKVSSLKGGKAFVVYLDLQSDEDSRQLKEWVALEGEGSSAPRIRINRRTAMRFEGTRKRRRAAMGDYAWSAGDRVDAWIHDGWREGVVTEKDQKDDAFTVHFPAEGETSVVRAWHLRPTLIWKDGEWIEWLTSKERDPSSQGDTPQEKRMKLGSSAIEGREKDSIAKNIERVESGKLAESRLPISANETIFNVGKNTRDENKPDALRTVRTGLQKEGSRVIFGIPKPGKKRKFMEVSKHYVADKSSKHNEPNDPVKFAKYLMPQGSGSRGWKNTKIDAKEKQPAESKTKFLKSGKPPSFSGRSLPQKEKLLNSARYAQNEGKETDHVVKDSVSSDKNESGKQSQMEFGSLSSTEGAAQGPVLFSSLAIPSDAPSKKISTSNAKSEWVNRRKPPPTTGKLAKVEVMNKLNSSNPGTSDPEAAEPRRSNRRIQPTSRLLEGLQSSLMISKIPAVLHDKSHRSQNKGSSKGNNHG